MNQQQEYRRMQAWAVLTAYAMTLITAAGSMPTGKCWNLCGRASKDTAAATKDA